ncbi:MAG TPA: hypothetical protein VF788_09840 [Pseudonocardiaceae bacterium]
MLPLRIEHLPLGDARLTLDVSVDNWHIDGLPPEVVPVLTPPHQGQRRHPERACRQAHFGAL